MHPQSFKFCYIPLVSGLILPILVKFIFGTDLTISEASYSPSATDWSLSVLDWMTLTPFVALSVYLFGVAPGREPREVKRLFIYTMTPLVTFYIYILLTYWSNPVSDMMSEETAKASFVLFPIIGTALYTAGIISAGMFASKTSSSDTETSQKEDSKENG